MNWLWLPCMARRQSVRLQSMVQDEQLHQQSRPWQQRAMAAARQWRRRRHQRQQSPRLRQQRPNLGRQHLLGLRLARMRCYIERPECRMSSTPQKRRDLGAVTAAGTVVFVADDTVRLVPKSAVWRFSPFPHACAMCVCLCVRHGRLHPAQSDNVFCRCCVNAPYMRPRYAQIGTASLGRSLRPPVLAAAFLHAVDVAAAVCIVSACASVHCNTLLPLLRI